ncbi:hypothetical protein B0T22DRAFT_189713 [Podospora appendiculata]|uniref:Uncharacterized protein n=1 Tax=Podospora appendiculata TaxID=314037 RepID=A0AAE0XCM3_9PEZI|nr:hypothetical protein B0T22DRAFT_189713 [Podospora appendiculata]
MPLSAFRAFCPRATRTFQDAAIRDRLSTSKGQLSPLAATLQPPFTCLLVPHHRCRANSPLQLRVSEPSLRCHAVPITQAVSWSILTAANFLLGNLAAWARALSDPRALSRLSPPFPGLHAAGVGVVWEAGPAYQSGREQTSKRQVIRESVRDGRNEPSACICMNSG